MATIDESALAGAKIRDMPINGKLRQVLLAAAVDAGVDVVRIASGGQPGSSGQRIGSNRHDGGNAADLDLIKNGRTLNFTVPSDLETICRFVAAAAANGAIGLGAGADYMGPTRLHVGFGNGPGDAARVVWGAGGAPANAPAWLSDAASRGWAHEPSGGVSIPGEVWPDQPIDGGTVPDGLDAGGGAPPNTELVGRLQGLRGALYYYMESAVFQRGAVALFQFCTRRRVTGVVDAGTWNALIEYAPFFRYAGLLIGALGVAGLVKSVGGSSPESYLEALDSFRDMLGKSTDPSLNHALDGLQQAWEAIKPSLQTSAATPPFDALLPALGKFVPGPAGSLLTAGVGIGLHHFGARIQRRLQA